MMQFSTINFGMDLVGKREIHCVQRTCIHCVAEKIISLTAGDNGNFVAARLVRIIAYCL